MEARVALKSLAHQHGSWVNGQCIVQMSPLVSRRFAGRYLGLGD